VITQEGAPSLTWRSTPSQQSRVDLEPLGEFAVAGFATAQGAFGLPADSTVKPAG